MGTIPWSLITKLKVGGHVHLDWVLGPEAAPPAGAASWLPGVEEVTAGLLVRGGAWILEFPLGFRTAPPTSIRVGAHAAELVDLAGSSDVPTEPPSVIRVGMRRGPSKWEGERHQWQWSDTPGVQTVWTATRTWEEADDDEPFTCTLLFEIG